MRKNYTFNFGIKKEYCKLLLVFALTFFGISKTNAQVTVNPGAANYTTLKGAFDAINAGTHTGVITVDINGDTTETATAVLNASGSGAASYTSIVITPSGGVTRTISGAATAGTPLIDFNGADNVVIDGLNSGGNALVISNTTASATSGTCTVRFIGGATNNTITNSTLSGSASMSVTTNGGVVFFSTDAVTANGNDNNTISNNNIGPAGTNLPTKGICSNGSTTTTAIGNSGNIINNNNIYDFFGAAVTSSGIAINGGSNSWTITNNRLYQTATRTWTTGAIHRGIDINNTSATSGAVGFTVTGNIVGYASNTQTGVYTLTGSTGKFQGIVFNGITGGTLSTINNNTIASVSLAGVTSSGTSTAAPFAGIIVLNGLANTNGNTIGSQSSTGSLVFSTNTTTASDVYGIYNFSLDDWTADNNTVGGISVTNAAASGTFLLYGMRANTSTTKSFNAAQNLVGGTVNNSIQLTATGASSQVIGMMSNNAAYNLTSNTVRNLTNNIGTGTTTGASVIGISTTTTTPNHTVSQNTIYNLRNTNTTAATTVTGIQFTGGTANVVQRNLIYDLFSDSNSATAEINGIRIAGGTTIYRNNMIRIGNGVTNAILVSGINEALGTNSVFHNSIYIDGAPTAGTASSFAFNGQQTVNTRSFRNNIFYNARNNSGATGKNYAVRVGGTGLNPTGLTINNNIYLANGTGGVFGFYASADVANLNAWKTVIGQDASSFELDPQYLNPTASVPDLHIHPTNVTPAEGNGFDVGVTNDFDGEVRASFSPVDIGADAGNFVGADLSAPIITSPSVSFTCNTGDRIISAVITDATGVPTSGVLQPRVYYRKNAGTWFSSAGNLVSGSATNGNWDFTIVAADMGGLVATDNVQYYLIAQDISASNNIASNPAGATASDVNTVTVAPSTPNTYAIASTINGVYTVGVTGNYPTLTAAVNAYNTSCLSGAVTFSLIDTSYPSETFPITINQNAFASAVNTLTIKPANGVSPVLAGSNAGPLFVLNAADYVIIDGSDSGAIVNGCAVGGDSSLRKFTMQNTNTATTASVISIQSGTNGAMNNVIKNMNIIGQDPTTTLVGISIGGSTAGTVGADNDNNTIENCAVQKAIFGIYAGGLSVANQNTGTVIKNNDLSSTATDRIRRVGVLVFNDNGANVSYNKVAVDTNESADGVGIAMGAQAIDATTTVSGGITGALVSNNRITGVVSSSTTGFSAVGISVSGAPGAANVIQNNMISGVTSPATSPDICTGIFVVGVTSVDTRLYHNTVYMSGDRGTVATQMPSFGLAITGVDPIVDFRNNIIYTDQIASGGGANAKSYAIGMVSTTFANLNSNYNDFVSSGANDGGFRSGSLGAGVGTDYASLASWATAVTDDANSVEITPVFVSASDLHLDTVLNPTLDNLGTAIVAVTQDFDCEARNATTPDMGADEGVFLSTNPVDAVIDFKVYPNPVANVLNIEYTSEVTSVSVFNLLGQQVLSKKVSAASTQIDMSALLAGTYLVKVESGNISKTLKVVKK